MPFTIQKRGPKNFAILRSGKTVGHSTSRAKAQRSINARNAGAHGATLGKGKK